MSETELKLLLPGADVAQIAAQFARHPALRRWPRQVQTLHNTYFDTPEQALRQQKVALRVRRQTSGESARAVWILTLKTAGSSVGGLSQRGEWETRLRNATPRLAALQGTPWATLDTDGSLWPRLSPAFVTTCTRTLWLLQQRGGSVIEVALDVGEIVAGGRRLPICELELELKAGPPEALFALARRLAASVPTMPGQASKAERGYALARDEADLPKRARPVALHASAPLEQALAAALGEIWDQTLRNTAGLMHSDKPELLHQARVGWRRLRGVARLLRPVLPPPPPAVALRAFWQASGPVRELDVMLTQTLPEWGPAYAGGDAQRLAEWAAVTDAVQAARAAAVQTLRERLAAPECGLDWLAWGVWLGGVSRGGEIQADGSQAGASQPASGAVAPDRPTQKRPKDWPAWVEQRLKRQHARLKRREEAALGEAERHELRLRAKRLRYATEAFASVLPKRRARRWQADAALAQQLEGDRRDILQCVMWLERLGAEGVEQGPLAFMRGVCAGRGAMTAQ